MARQPMVRPDSAETRLNHDPPASAEVPPSPQSRQFSTHAASDPGAGQPSSTAAFDEVLKLVAEQACLATSASSSAIALSDGDEIVCRATAGAHAPELGARLNSSTGLTGACLRTRQYQYCEDTDSDPRVNAAACRRLQVRSVMVIPVLHQDQLLGIMEIFSPFPKAFARHDLQNLEALSQVILENLRTATDSAVFPGDEPLFASAPESAIADRWADAPAIPAEPVAPPLELSAIRWEPPEAQATFLDQAPAEKTSPSAVKYPRHPAHDLFAAPMEPTAPSAPVAPAKVAARTPARVVAPEPKIAPPPPPRSAPKPPAPAPVFQPSLQPVANDGGAQRRDWTTNFLTLTVIAVALLLGWMLGHAGWQRIVNRGKNPSASSSNKSGPASSRAAANDADPSAVEAADAVFPAAANPVRGANRARTPSKSTPFQPKSDADAGGGLTVYEGGKIIFQQTAPKAKPGHFTTGNETKSNGTKSDETRNLEPGQSRSGEAGNSPRDAVSLSPEAASAYLIRRVEPVYPEEARQQNIQGEVHLEALVGKDGSVQVLRLISGDSQLAEAAADAVRQWRFRPYKSNGRAEEFNTRLTVSFRLQ
jgi:TonB family protein